MFDPTILFIIVCVSPMHGQLIQKNYVEYNIIIHLHVKAMVQELLPASQAPLTKKRVWRDDADFL